MRLKIWYALSFVVFILAAFIAVEIIDGKLRSLGIDYALALVGGVILFSISFRSRARREYAWMRLIFRALGPILVMWSLIGGTLLFYSSRITPRQYHLLQYLKPV